MTDDGRQGINSSASDVCRPFSDFEHNQVPKGYLADALALRGDEGRGTLR